MKMMLSGLVCCLLALAVPVRAAEVQAPSTAKAGGQKLDQAIAQQQATVKALQGEVDQQESKAHQASDKLKAQDQQIADLQKQLDALKTAPRGGAHP